MAWQENTETGRIIHVAKAAENTAAPSASLPKAGSSIAWTSTASGEIAFGWTVNDFEMTEDDFEFSDAEGTPIPVDPPLALKKIATIHDKADTPDTVSFTSYEIGEKVLNWAGNVTKTSDVFTKSATYTRNAMVIEVEGLGFHYFPAVEFKVATSGGGVKTLGTQAVVADVFAGSSVLAGYSWTRYEDA